MNLNFEDFFKGKRVIVYVNLLKNNIISCNADFKDLVGLKCTKVLFKEALYKVSDTKDKKILLNVGKQYVANLDKFYIDD